MLPNSGKHCCHSDSNTLQNSCKRRHTPNTNTIQNIDVVNNVENVYIPPLLATTNGYAVTVLASRVNVNAVTAQTNDVVQDYALVISSGDGAITNAATVTTPAGVADTNAANNVDFLAGTADSLFSYTDVNGFVVSGVDIRAGIFLGGAGTGEVLQLRSTRSPAYSQGGTR